MGVREGCEAKACPGLGTTTVGANAGSAVCAPTERAAVAVLVRGSAAWSSRNRIVGGGRSQRDERHRVAETARAGTSGATRLTSIRVGSR